MGSTRSALDSYMDSKPSLFDPVSEWVGFKRWLNGARGQALAPAERERVVRLAASLYSTLKTPIAVRAGHTVTLSIAPEDRPHAAFMFRTGDGQRGRQAGPYSGYRVASGTARVRFIACRADQPKFSGPGRVGPWTWFPGAMVVAGARCLTIEASERGRPTLRYYLGFGRNDCRAEGPRLLSARYGQMQPPGAPSPYPGLRIRTLYRAGQVVGLRLEELDTDAGMQILDGGCGLAAPGNGRVGTWTIPMRLAPGTHRFRLTMEGSRCGGLGRNVEATDAFSVSVP